MHGNVHTVSTGGCRNRLRSDAAAGGDDHTGVYGDGDDNSRVDEHTSIANQYTLRA